MQQLTSLASLDADEVRSLWSRTYNREGKPDWSHIFPYHHENVAFRDSIQEARGIEELKALCDRLTQRCRQLRMDIPSILKEGPDIFMQWETTMVFKKFPSPTIYGATKLTLHEDGRIISQRDYYDLWGDIFDNIPWFAGCTSGVGLAAAEALASSGASLITINRNRDKSEALCRRLLSLRAPVRGSSK